MIVFGSVRSGLFRVSSAGGVPTAVTTLADGEDAHRWPHFLPDGRHFFYTAVTGACCPPAKPGAIKIGSLDPAEPAVALLQADSSATYASGHMLFARDETMMAQAFDPDARQLTGDAVPVTERVSTEGSRYVSASVSENGTLVYAPGGSLNPQQLTWFDRAGKILGTLGEGGDGRQSFALAGRTPGRSRPAQRESGESRHLDDRHRPQAAEPRDVRCATRRMAGMVARWHAHRVRNAARAASGEPPEKARLVQTLVNGTGANETLFEAVDTPSRPCGPRQCAIVPTDWSADGRFVLYTFSGTFPATSDIWALPLFGDRKPFPVAQTEFSESLGTFSPDGRWIAYTTDETGQPNVYVQPFLRAGRKYRISPNGGRNPHWRADGKELFYLDATGAMTAVPIDATDTFAAGLPKTLFPAGVISANQHVRGDQGWTAVPRQPRPQNAATATPLTVIVNWTSTLQK